MKVSNDLLPTIYEVAIQVFDKKLSLKDGKEKLVGNGRMNANTAADFINNFKYMINGIRYTRAMSEAVTRYFLQYINIDFTPNGLTKALTSLKLHIDYYEGTHANRPMIKIRKVYKEFSSQQTDSSNEVQQETFLWEIRKQKQSREHIIYELKNLKPSDPEEVIINGKAYKRDNRTIAQLKYLRNFSCQICSTAIQKRDGTFYVEAAHIHPKHLKGSETPNNILILCPNHHKEFDYGDRGEVIFVEDSVKFWLNGQSYSISLALK